MVADTDKGGEKEDEYFSEVTREEHIEGEEAFKFNDPLANVEIEDAEVAPQKSSAMKKVGMIIVIVIVALIVSMYLTHKQKMKEAAEMGKDSTQTATPKALPEIKTDVKPAEKSAANQTNEMKAPVKTDAATPATSAASVPSADNASLAAAISKGVNPVAPAKSETDLAAAISKDQAAPTVATPVANKSAEKSVTPATKSEPDKTAVKPDENAVAKTAESPSKELPTKVSEPTVPVVSSETPKIMGRIDDLNLQTQANQTKISDLSTRLETIDKSMVEMNKSLVLLEKKLSAPQAAVVKVEPETPTPPVFKKVEKAPATLTPKKMTVAAEHHGKSQSRHQTKVLPQPQQHVVMKEPSRPVMPYVLRAIVPGRAWVERPMAGVVSVMEGDYLPGVGKVVTIDDQNGQVTLDTGDVIKYGMDDH